MKRRVLPILATLSLLLGVVMVCGAFTPTDADQPFLYWNVGRWGERLRMEFTAENGFQFFCRPNPDRPVGRDRGEEWQYPGIAIARRHMIGAHRNSFVHEWVIHVKPQLIFVLSSLLPLLWLVVTARRIIKRNPGRCSNCGYDLRATPDRCPECGTVPQVRPSASHS